MNIIELSEDELKELERYTLHDLIKMMKGELLIPKRSIKL